MKYLAFTSGIEEDHKKIHDSRCSNLTPSNKSQKRRIFYSFLCCYLSLSFSLPLPLLLPHSVSNSFPQAFLAFSVCFFPLATAVLVTVGSATGPLTCAKIDITEPNRAYWALVCALYTHLFHVACNRVAYRNPECLQVTHIRI